jgi:predicted ABC-class ATPase
MPPPDRFSRYRTRVARPPRRDAAVPPLPHAEPRAPGTGLRGLLRTIDGGPFQSYRRILGEHELGEFRLTVLSVPPDALGGPARLRLSIDRAGAGLLGEWSRGDVSRVVVEDFIVRAAVRAIGELSGTTAASAPGSGRIWIDPPGPTLAERTTARVDDDRLDLSLAIDLPASDRRVRGQQAEAILFEHLPRVGMAALVFSLRRVDEVKPLVEAAARRRAVAASLEGLGLAALVPSPSLSGRTASPEACTTIETALGSVAGLAIPTGITLFVSPGIAGTGAWLRELVAASGSARGETAIFGSPVATLHASRRAFGPLDVRAFVRACPDVPNPEAHMTEDAPPPLGVSASLVEAYEAGARILVLDEDETPAGAFGGDGRMLAVLGDTPALCPLTERLAELRDRWGLSFFIAARAASGLCDVADTVLILRDDRIDDATAALRGPQRAPAVRPGVKARAVLVKPSARSMRIVTEGAPSHLKVAAWGSRGVRVGEDLVDLKDTTLAGDAARLRTVAALLKRAASEASAWRPVVEVLDALEAATTGVLIDRLEEPGLLDLAQPSRVEIAAALVRWRRVTFRVPAGRLSAKTEETP